MKQLVFMVLSCSQCLPAVNCSLVPYSVQNPCYHGPRDAVQALKVKVHFSLCTSAHTQQDPLVQNTSIVCGNCQDSGFDFYYRDDFLEPEVELYTSYLKYCVQCTSSDLCLILPPIKNQTEDSICAQGTYSQVQVKFDLVCHLPPSRAFLLVSHFSRLQIRTVVLWDVEHVKSLVSLSSIATI
jgi:hypothetical protein